PADPANNPLSVDEDTGTSLLRAEYSNKQFQLGLQKMFWSAENLSDAEKMRFPSCPTCLSRNTSPSPQHASMALGPHLMRG
ncbi:hypothetical protein, partial [Escherichia coli]|uniref:hypothetical protein n=1 Tax=Escherichia coli TaxID=562 RepID=UPI0027387C73